MFCALAVLLEVVGWMIKVSQQQRVSHPDSPLDRLFPAGVEPPQKAEQRADRGDLKPLEENRRPLR